MSDTPTQDPPHTSGEVDACSAAGTVGAEHEVLKKLEGEWAAAVQFWMQPGADPVSAEGTMANEWILGGRFLQQRYASNFMGSPFEGFGLFGYNKIDGRYEGVWADTMSTAMMREEGQYQPDMQVFTMFGEVTEPGSKKLMRKKTVISIDSDDQHTMSMYFADEGSDSFWKCMEIVYKRA